MAEIPVMKFGGVTVQGEAKFGDVSAHWSELEQYWQARNLDELYKLLTSMRNRARARRLQEICRDFVVPLLRQGIIPVIVISAFDRATAKLMELYECVGDVPGDQTRELSPESQNRSRVRDPRLGNGLPYRREEARLVMTGELRANAAMANTLNCLGWEARSLTGREAGLVTRPQDGPVDATIERVDPTYIWQLLDDGVVPVVAGYQGYYGVSGRQEFSILGRGGSNLTAVAIAHALGQSECTMYTDVDGLYDKDPRKFPEAIKLREVQAQDLWNVEKFPEFPDVIQDKAVEYAMAHGVDIIIRSGFDPGAEGSRIVCRQKGT